MGFKTVFPLVIATILQNTRASELREVGAEIQKQSEELEQRDRDGKFLSVFQIVRFQNLMCTASSGEVGTCYTEKECTSKGGTASGTCAEGFGVCCIFTLSESGSTVSEDNTYIQNPGYPAGAPVGMYMYNLGKCDAGVCQYKITFEDFEISGPANGDCTNDTLMFSGFDDVSTRVVPMTLCGSLTGQHIYVSVKAVTEDPKMVINIVQMDSHWRIRIDQIPCTETENLAPRGCLTYEMGEQGTLSSFNNNGGNGELINDQRFCHCIQDIDGFCDVSLTSSNFDLGAGDSITFVSNTQTGMNFGAAGMLTWNYTGPYVACSISNDMNTNMNMGYSIDYMLLPC